MNNYPPGVTGNEPHLTGVWPTEELLDHVIDRVNKVEDEIGDIASLLDDQGQYYFDRHIERAIDAIEERLKSLKEDLRGKYPPDEYDDPRL